MGSQANFDCEKMNVPGRSRSGNLTIARRTRHVGHSNGEMRMNTYEMIEWCAALRNHVEVKRVLMSEEGMREEYGCVKRQLEKREFANIGDCEMAGILWRNFWWLQGGRGGMEVRRANF